MTSPSQSLPFFIIPHHCPHHYSQIADTKKKWFYRLLTYNLHGKTAKFLPHVGKKILVGTSNGWFISVWNASEMRRIHFSSLLLKVCNADLEILCDGSFSHHVKSYSFMFLQKISTRVVCVNGEHPSNIGCGRSLQRSAVEDGTMDPLPSLPCPTTQRRGRRGYDHLLQVLRRE